MANAQLTMVVSLGGVSFQKTITETGDHPNVYGDGVNSINLAAGKDVTGWTQTDADTAQCTLGNGHGYSNGKMDVFWDGGSRYDVDGTVDGDTLDLDGGTGDNFPATNTNDIIVCTPQQINTAIDGDNIQMLVIQSTTRASCYFEDSGAAAVNRIHVYGNQPYTYYQQSGDTSPLTGNPATVCYASCGANTAGVIAILSLEDSTP